MPEPWTIAATIVGCLASLERCFVLLGDAYRYEHTDLRACLVLADSAASLWVVWMLPILGSTHRRVRFVWRKPLVLPVRLCVAAARLPSVLLAMLLVWPWVSVFRDVGSRTVTMEPHGASCLSISKERESAAGLLGCRCENTRSDWRRWISPAIWELSFL